jgi:hypothetical protein
MEEQFLVEFVKKYGLKEGIILSCLCEITNQNESGEEYVFTVEDIKKRFAYFSEKQLRTGISKLLNQEAIKYYEQEKEFSRTLFYTVNNKIFVRYLKILNKRKAMMGE